MSPTVTNVEPAVEELVSDMVGRVVEMRQEERMAELEEKMKALEEDSRKRGFIRMGDDFTRRAMGWFFRQKKKGALGSPW